MSLDAAQVPQKDVPKVVNELVQKGGVAAGCRRKLALLIIDRVKATKRQTRGETGCSLAVRRVFECAYRAVSPAALAVVGRAGSEGQHAAGCRVAAEAAAGVEGAEVQRDALVQQEGAGPRRQHRRHARHGRGNCTGRSRP